MIKLGENSIDKLYLGNTQIAKVYLGNTLIHPESPPERILLQTVNVNIASVEVSVPTWNDFLLANKLLNNIIGGGSGWTLAHGEGTYNIEGPYANATTQQGFPQDVLAYLAYTENSVKELILTGLNNANTYDFQFASYLGNGAAANDHTRITVNGEEKIALVEQDNVLYLTEFNNIVPASGSITITFTGLESNYYGCLNGFIIKEYV